MFSDDIVVLRTLHTLQSAYLYLACVGSQPSSGAFKQLVATAVCNNQFGQVITKMTITMMFYTDCTAAVESFER